jgi:hypothetical protein
MSNNSNNREERRKASFVLAGTSTYILALSLLAAGGFAIISFTITPLTTTVFAQELDNNNIPTGQPGGGPERSACAPPQTEGGGGGQNATTNATTMDGGSANVTTGNATTTAGGGNQFTSQVTDNIESACIALQVGDIEGAMMYLDMALSAVGGGGIQGNMTTSIPSGITDGTTTDGSSGGGTIIGGSANITTSGGGI